jgi:hypothetical protein
LSLRGIPLCGTTQQSSWIAAARFAHLAMMGQEDTDRIFRRWPAISLQRGRRGLKKFDPM